jgi:hypothetical protein
MAEQLSMLGELDAFEISLVDRGANLKKPFPIHKQEKLVPDMKEILEADMKEILDAVFKTEVEAETKVGEIFKDISDEGAAAVAALIRTLTAFRDELPDNAVAEVAKLAGYKAPEAPADPDPDPKPESPTATVLKAMPAEIRKQMEPLIKAQQAERDAQQAELDVVRKSNAVLEATVLKEREDRERGEWVAKARTDLSCLPGSSHEELGATLYELHKANPELAAKQFDVLKASSTAIAKGGLLDSVGTGGGGASAQGSDALEVVNKLADEIVKKSETAITHADAVTRVIKARPDLYEDYKKEMAERTR